ncbi:S26 family signal peptidase [Kribbella sp. NPDC026611]|uniref:S26 family signal peptidase n=1 Tax=Kribbella sp. NPDC026611 TaxID=3154911 RepID=UPI0033C8B785
MRTSRMLPLAVAVVAAAAVALRKALVITNVHGMSMAPTFRDGERLLAVRGLRRLRTGDVVLCRIPSGYSVPGAGGDALLVKRVAALPGDPEPPGPAAEEVARISPGHVYVLGDALGHSLDSRTFGPLPQASIVGIVVGRLPIR